MSYKLINNTYNFQITFDKLSNVRYPVFTVVYAMSRNKSMDYFEKELEFNLNGHKLHV